MATFTCPVEECTKELKRLQVMHFRYKHECDPVEWVEETHGTELRQKYAGGVGCYRISEEYEWLSPEMVQEVVDTRTHKEALSGENNPMKRKEVVKHFRGENNPAKRPAVRKKIRETNTGHVHSEETKKKISEKNTGNTISEAHRRAISEAAAAADKSYMQTDEYRQKLSESLKGREPTYPKPYSVPELSHKVRSSWEEEIAKLLVHEGIEYQYEERFSISDRAYYPDFIIEDSIVEVKGFANERAVKKAVSFMEEYPSYTYIVVGDELPCDIHVPWENRESIIEVIRNG